MPRLSATGRQTEVKLWVRRWVVTAWLLLSAAASAQGGLQLTPMILELGADQGSRTDVIASNAGDEPLYLDVIPARIDQPGQTGETRQVEDDPDALGLLVTPRRFVLQPGGTRRIRVAALQPPGEVDRVYRILVKPAVADTPAETSQIRVVVGYDLLVFVRPTRPTIAIEAERRDGALILRNQGNSNVLFQRGEFCVDAQPCTPLTTRRVYPGASVRIELPGRDGTVRFLQTQGDRVSPVEY